MGATPTSRADSFALREGGVAAWAAGLGLLPLVLLAAGVLAENWVEPGWPLATVAPPGLVRALIYACFVSLPIAALGLLGLVVVGAAVVVSWFVALGARA